MRAAHITLLALAVVALSHGLPSGKGKDNFPTCTAAFPDPVVCDANACELDNDCACFRTEPNITLSKRPQIVYLTFDDGFTKLAMDNYYSKIFDGHYKNPNDCPIRATHFLTHQSTDYSLVNKYYAMGHEMASHSITHRSNTTYWSLLSEQGWVDEMVGMRTIISNFANIPESDITGIRVPYLQSGGDTQFAMMSKNNFHYDCSRPTQAFGYMNMANGAWPFTMDYQVKMDCQISPCPKCSFPGVWVQPMLDLEDNWLVVDGHGNPCAMLDSCIVPGSSDPEDYYQMLKKNFDRSYNGNTRAPFGLYVHAAWFFGQDYRFAGYQKFLDEITALDDVWIVPINAGLEYRKNPKTNAELTSGALEAFNCDSFPAEDCFSPAVCSYHVNNEDIVDQEVYMKICAFDCPANYPWLGNPLGN